MINHGKIMMDSLEKIVITGKKIIIYPFGDYPMLTGAG